MPFLSSHRVCCILLCAVTAFCPVNIYAQAEYQDTPLNPCTRWFDFSTLGISDTLINSSQTNSELLLNASLIYRPLLVTEDHYWLGVQLYQSDVAINGEAVVEPLYSVPFAIKLDKIESRIQQIIFNAPVKQTDQSKLTGIYQALHISKANNGENLKKYIVEGNDDLGIFEVEFLISDSENHIEKRKLGYKQISQSVSDGIIASIKKIDVKKDQTIFQQDNCWHVQAEGNSSIQVLSENNFLDIRVAQQLDLIQKHEPLPGDARLLSLPLDPNEWEMLPEEYIYPKPERQPEASGEDFLRNLAILDLANMSSEAILQFLYDNDEYIPLLKGPLWASAYDNEFEKRLFLMIGKTDSHNAHWLLSEIYSDESFNGDARFRSLMALKYAEKPIAQELVDQILLYSTQPLQGENAKLASSGLMVMGIVASNQLDNKFGQHLSDRMATELSNSYTTQTSAALLTAMGNIGDERQTNLVTSYLGSEDALLRERSAESLAKMPNEQSLHKLSTLLSSESNKRVQSAILTGMGGNQLNDRQLNQVYSFAKDASENKVRRSAIQALINQSETHPEVKTQLKELLKTEKNRSNLQEILRSIY